MDDHAFQAFLESALDELGRKDYILQSSYGVGSHSRWHYDQAEQSVLFFDHDDRCVVEADAVVIGSFASESSSWRWGWANDTALPEMRCRSASLRELAELTGLAMFENEHAFEIEGEEMAWELVALSVHQLQAAGGYRIPSASRPLFTYLALTHVRRVAT